MGTKGAVKKKYVVTATASDKIQDYDPARVYEDYDESGATAQMIHASKIKLKDAHKHQFRVWPEGSEQFEAAVEEGEQLKAIASAAKEISKSKLKLGEDEKANEAVLKKIADLEAKLEALESGQPEKKPAKKPAAKKDADKKGE